MKESFSALWASNPSLNTDDFAQLCFEIKKTRIDDLSPGNVIIENHYSSINYKDALALTGKGKILRRLPLIPGIDVSGLVAKSSSSLYSKGDKVLIHGANFGETMCGGFSEYSRVPEKTLVKLPEEMSLKEAMIYGTAGFTAALAINQLELNGLTPEKGSVLVTGATGGVGSLALSFLNSKGYTTEAWTRRKKLEPWLKECGATTVTNTSHMDFKTSPLAKATWSAAIDNIGGDILSYILPRIDLWGSVASIGLAQSEKLNSTVFPFILRGVNLLGTSSNNCPQDLRQKIWSKIATEFKPKNLDSILSQEISLEELPAVAEKIIHSELFGRTIVNYNK